MKMMLIAGVLITLPAIVVVVWFFGATMALPAAASLAVNFLPFLVVGWLMSRHRGENDEMEHH